MQPHSVPDADSEEPQRWMLVLEDRIVAAPAYVSTPVTPGSTATGPDDG